MTPREQAGCVPPQVNMCARVWCTYLWCTYLWCTGAFLPLAHPGLSASVSRPDAAVAAACDGHAHASPVSMATISLSVHTAVRSSSQCARTMQGLINAANIFLCVRNLKGEKGWYSYRGVRQNTFLFIFVGTEKETGRKARLPPGSARSVSPPLNRAASD